jgi:hypothetical protein
VASAAASAASSLPWLASRTTSSADLRQLHGCVGGLALVELDAGVGELGEQAFLARVLGASDKVR